jgi:hypothetical protein
MRIIELKTSHLNKTNSPLIDKYNFKKLRKDVIEHKYEEIFAEQREKMKKELNEVDDNEPDITLYTVWLSKEYAAYFVTKEHAQMFIDAMHTKISQNPTAPEWYDVRLPINTPKFIITTTTLDDSKDHEHITRIMKRIEQVDVAIESIVEEWYDTIVETLIFPKKE